MNALKTSRILLFVTVLAACFVFQTSAIGQGGYYWQWAHGFYGGSLLGVEAHPSDGCFISGVFPDSLTYNGSVLQGQINTGTTAYLMRVSGYGTPLWTQYGSNGLYIEERPLTLNSSTRAWTTYDSSFVFGDSTALSVNGHGLVVTDIEENGSISRWAHYPDLFEFYSTDEKVLLTTDAQDNIFLAVHYQDSLLFNGMMYYAPFSNTGKKMVFITRITADGTVAWTQNAGMAERLLQVDAVNNQLYLSTFKPDSISPADSLLGGYTFENSLVVLDTLGQRIWRETTYNCIGCLNEQQFAVFANGDVIRANTVVSTSGDRTQYIARLNGPTGSLMWEQFSNFTSGNIRTDRLIPLVNGGFVNSGFYFSNFAWTSSIPQSPPSMFVAEFDSNGNIQWARSAGSSVMSGECVTDHNGNLYCSGFVDSGGNFDGQVVGSSGFPFPPYIAKLTSSPLAIQEQTHLEFSAKPNPVFRNSGLSIRIGQEEFLEAEKMHLTVINSLGQRVEELQIASSRFEIQAPRESGIYYLHLSARNTWIGGTKLVVE